MGTRRQGGTDGYGVRIRGLWTSFRAAPLPIVFTSLTLLLAMACLHGGWASLASQLALRGLCLIGASLFLTSTTLCSMADAHCRIREYLRIKELLMAYGFRPRLFRRRSRSRCQRDAALQAAREAGCYREMRAYFSSQGYRWYHLLPDTIAVSPLAFFSRHFLRSTFLPCKPTSARPRSIRPAAQARTAGPNQALGPPSGEAA